MAKRGCGPNGTGYDAFFWGNKDINHIRFEDRLLSCIEYLRQIGI